eukprot:CAMPEP_0197631260 /NCGR_PEP_ID=MMETSP1338-20131121/8487_1 /TAXON_ID=43686 ORGANISM="Pelagodinium beii, Strain RCC1491" /NCGR_SAMPLE_ID=MMETSP1338 /ASSEMBLY_ACC=CAM_ASM_000754 /LENGTH=161 /DNA_ID=CAMNT_0043202675 /DNA_START=102 /DNA_END=583 /DNA_ORIENTATION=-
MAQEKSLAMNQLIGKEDGKRWDQQDHIGLHSGIKKVPRAHTTIGAIPGQMRSVPLSPRKTSSKYMLEQTHEHGSSSKNLNDMDMREKLYHGVAAHGQGRAAYLKARADTSLRHRYGRFPATTSQAYGFGDMWAENPTLPTMPRALARVAPAVKLFSVELSG